MHLGFFSCPHEYYEYTEFFFYDAFGIILSFTTDSLIIHPSGLCHERGRRRPREGEKLPFAIFVICLFKKYILHNMSLIFYDKRGGYNHYHIQRYTFKKSMSNVNGIGATLAADRY